MDLLSQVGHLGAQVLDYAGVCVQASLLRQDLLETSKLLR